MARSVVHRQVSSVRRTSVPRSSGSLAAAGMTTSFGRMLAKLTSAGDSLQGARPKRKR